MRLVVVCVRARKCGTGYFGPVASERRIAYATGAPASHNVVTLMCVFFFVCALCLLCTLLLIQEGVCVCVSFCLFAGIVVSIEKQAKRTQSHAADTLPPVSL